MTAESTLAYGVTHHVLRKDLLHDSCYSILRTSPAELWITVTDGAFAGKASAAMDNLLCRYTHGEGRMFEIIFDAANQAVMEAEVQERDSSSRNESQVVWWNPPVSIVIHYFLGTCLCGFVGADFDVYVIKSVGGIEKLSPLPGTGCENLLTNAKSQVVSMQMSPGDRILVCSNITASALKAADVSELVQSVSTEELPLKLAERMINDEGERLSFSVVVAEFLSW